MYVSANARLTLVKQKWQLFCQPLPGVNLVAAPGVPVRAGRQKS